MLKYKLIKYANNTYSLLIGSIHNSSESREFSSYVLNQTIYKFDFYILELNINNFLFIKHNKIKISEFFQFTNEKIPKDKLIFIDISLEKELKAYSDLKINKKLSNNFFVDYLSFRLDKFLYYKIKNIDNRINADQFQSIKYFHDTHINFRENAMKDEIKKFRDKNNLIVVGVNHYKAINHFMSKII